MNQKHALAAAGSTGNATHPSVFVDAVYDAVAFVFEITAVGATPTVTWKVQGSPDGTEVVDANARWFDVGYITDASDTIATTTRVQTAIGSGIGFLSNPVARRYARFRLVSSANTNVTYKADLFTIA